MTQATTRRLFFQRAAAVGASVTMGMNEAAGKNRHCPKTSKGGVMSGMLGLLVSVAMAFWVYQVVSRRGGQLPWLWAIGTLLLWPVFITIVGFKYDETAMKWVGSIVLLVTIGAVLWFGSLFVPT